ncbi:Peptidase M22, glycoprotease [Metarhizium rileyi]|uniref:N(6)-L-threonylcarbamoyladenine synthase n=1 Tax=Metarhizium rileyi (strain RCEF 4871) TaxID=1649241 RepID=A0A167E161_METRR|nr:Peptidase M22, glycoprotease [Metarhizium rileyi RCEF 4871]
MNPTPANTTRAVDDGEVWEDDDVLTTIDAGEQVQIGRTANVLPPPQSTVTRSLNLRASSQSKTKVRRVKSRQRQKAQNAKAGIRLITDMSVFRRNNTVANQMRSPTVRTGKFVDAAALRALEGEPSSASVGNWNWLKKGNGKASESAKARRTDRNKDQQLSPQDRPIVIGISLESLDMEGRENSPQPAMIGKPKTPFPTVVVHNHRVSQLVKANIHVHQSVWSPDTPETLYSFGSNPQVSIEKQMLNDETPPPVPELPSDYKKPAHPRILTLELGKARPDDEDTGTPCTLFEEDGVPGISPQSHPKAKEMGISPDSAGSRSHGWWDHVVTPFVDKRMSFSSRKIKGESSKSPNLPRSHKGLSKDEPRTNQDAEEKFVATPSSPRAVPVPVQVPIVRTPTPRRTPPPRRDGTPAENPQATMVKTSVKAPNPSMEQTPTIVFTRDCASPSDNPPPYSPPKKKQHGEFIRYRAVFPPGHPLHSQFPPSPRPPSPGLAGTMTSQRRHLTEPVDHTPALLRTQTSQAMREPLPVRAVGTIVPQEHAYCAAGSRHRVERQRRRHEKEDIIARRAGGFWRGRGCIPSTGCFGRTGREGRKRRRIWMAVWAGVVALVILIILLATLLTRHHRPSPGEVSSIWVNLTDFPPMPTGVLTVVGPDNVAARTVCTEPSTLWSCSLPKDQQSSVLPYKPNQPTLIMQIQWDNGTRRAWNVPNADPPATLSRRALGAAAHALSVLKRDPAPTEFTPNPAPPQFKEMWFLGETTDNIKSDQKGGEPAPFYISLLKSTNDTAPTPNLARRGVSPNIGNTTFKNLIPPPDVERDGTSAPAVLMPKPVQQPVRLYDRGLPTEHYGFYTYFRRTIFLKSVNIPNKTDSNVPLDEDGGCRKTEASHLVTWGETRLHVQIWTRALSRNTSSLLEPDDGKGIGGTGELVRPGTMPYPVTISQDTHGGDPDKKLVWDRPVDERLQVETVEAQALINNMGIGGTWINKRASGDAKLGGFDGGSGGSGPQRSRSLLTLAIESSCDDTAVAVLSHSAPTATLLFNERISSDNRAFKGVHPVVTVQGHNSSLAPLVRRALLSLPPASPGAPSTLRIPSRHDGTLLKQRPDFVSVTRGPGIMANLAVGLNTAKGLAVGWDVPLVAVHHMQAHALTPRLVRALDGNAGPRFPFLSLLVSGGHTLLVHSAGLTDHRVVATTADIAIGNLLDQTARVILPAHVLQASPDVMYGRQLESFAFQDSTLPKEKYSFFRPATSRSDEIASYPTGYAWDIPLPFRNTRRPAYSFSSIHTHVHRIAASNPAMSLDERRSLARHTMRAAFQHLCSRLVVALEDTPELRPAAKTIVVSGGVASNKFLLHVLGESLRARGFPDAEIIAPPVQFCTDNAAMIAWTGLEMFEAGWCSDLSCLPVGKWPMEIDGGGGDGILGAGGWLRREEPPS